MKCVKLQTKFDRLSVKELGRGAAGRIYAICEATEKVDSGCKKIIKIIIEGLTENIKKEIEIFKQLNDSEITPKIFESFKCGAYYYIVQERFDTNMMKRADDLNEERYLDNAFFSAELWKEEELRVMFEIAFELSYNFGIIHGDLKPDQFLYRKSDNKIVVSDFGFSGTVDGKLEAERGWSWFGECGNFQPLPPRVSATPYYGRYFNMYQLWSYLAFRERPVRVLLKDDKTLRYLSSTIYPYRSGQLAIPQAVINIFIEDETQYGVVELRDNTCIGRRIATQEPLATERLQAYIVP